MGCKFEIELNNQLEIYDIGNIARQASGSVMLRIKNAVVLAAVARDDRQVEEDFLPLTVQYIEKSYAAGKIPGGYIKRETKPGDFETLTSRLVDRSLRPLFPKGYAYPTQITILVLSSDKDMIVSNDGGNDELVELFDKIYDNFTEVSYVEYIKMTADEQKIYEAVKNIKNHSFAFDGNDVDRLKEILKNSGVKYLKREVNNKIKKFAYQNIEKLDGESRAVIIYHRKMILDIISEMNLQVRLERMIK